ncbi:uncharacterized protein ARMOST_06041 [Armillaria ostoyae]|uniref:Uncharacterized protein n=1 Tax=Armillaria ostoyae TaxID=47428 RepID=A0A284R1W9_ARMOS|nr:uncharacterized protein ARMOST_06041 [Armillaria ostoyae]
MQPRLMVERVVFSVNGPPGPREDKNVAKHNQISSANFEFQNFWSVSTPGANANIVVFFLLPRPRIFCGLMLLDRIYLHCHIGSWPIMYNTHSNTVPVHPNTLLSGLRAKRRSPPQENDGDDGQSTAFSVDLYSVSLGSPKLVSQAAVTSTILVKAVKKCQKSRLQGIG